MQITSSALFLKSNDIFFVNLSALCLCICPYLLRSWLHSVCSISLIWLSSLAGGGVLGAAVGWLQLQHSSVLSAGGASLGVGWLLVSSF